MRKLLEKFKIQRKELFQELEDFKRLENNVEMIFRETLKERLGSLEAEHGIRIEERKYFYNNLHSELLRELKNNG